MYNTQANYGRAFSSTSKNIFHILHYFNLHIAHFHNLSLRFGNLRDGSTLCEQKIAYLIKGYSRNGTGNKMELSNDATNFQTKFSSLPNYKSCS